MPELIIKKQRAYDEIEYQVIIDGQAIGLIARGWQRLGGNQWIVYCKEIGLNQRGFSTLAECKQAIIRNINKGGLLK